MAKENIRKFLIFLQLVFKLFLVPQFKHRSVRKSSYTPEDLENALQAILMKRFNVKQASKRFNIPYETLRSNALKRRAKVVREANLLLLKMTGEKLSEKSENSVQIKVEKN
jgi:hypothetical protein